jgi:hypothetical protein
MNNLDIRVHSVRRKNGRRCPFIERKKQNRLLEYVRSLKHVEKVKANEKAAALTKKELLENCFEKLRNEGKELPRWRGEPNMIQIGLKVTGTGRYDFYAGDLRLALSI